ncbi:flagellar biosynthesis protein FlhF [Vibrio sp. TH_r3]|uniref:flagellar biosynthesis protein FlhF n=1 Tax=Vibrio sp. TH_r3 TaxID=3082084 RepID=UPI002955D657|nr:flagellar biosynthesis protein FlhF [Vibrio sp. TH_r3]MDV7103206.1 flagellar biosynthesis protein FlhF [Vibrio sp. TH_r3]
MKIKRFFAKDMRLALLQVKEELGSEAVIMSNKKVAGGVEIVAAIDGDMADKPVAKAPPRVQSRYSSESNKAHESQYQRDLTDDRVSLQTQSAAQSTSSAQRNASDSKTKRFANMLKQYSRNEDSNDGNNSEADSLAALLKRQSSTNNASQPQVQAQHGTISSSLAKDSGLAKLISDDYRSDSQRAERPKPRLDPSRYERNYNQSADNEENNQELNSMREEMMSIRRLLEHQVSGLMWQEVERREPLRAMLIKRLERMGLSSELADQLACYISEDTPPAQAWKELLDLVSDQVSVIQTDILKRGGVVALLGPTGVGKTTTIAKLAARAAMEYGPDNVALVTTDTFRIGAHEQLAIYGRIMGCPVKIAKDSEDLAEVIYQLRNRRLVLVDTAGMGQRDVRLTEQLDTLMQDSGSVINSYLVLPATAQRRVLQETIDHFKRIPLSGCILTKIDESLSLGEFISVIVQNSLPVAYVANGQRVPEDIVIAQPKYLVAKANELLEKSTENEPHYWTSDTDGF